MGVRHYGAGATELRDLRRGWPWARLSAEREKRCPAPREELQLRFDGFGKFLVANQTLNFFYDFAVARDEETSGVAEETAELVGDFVVADDDGIVHGKFLAVDVEALLGEEGSDGGLAFFVHGDAQNGKAFCFVLLLHLNEPGNFDIAGIAPGGPEIDQHDFAFVLTKRGVFGLQIFEGDVRSGLSGGLDADLLGALHRVGDFDARGLIGVVGADDERDDGSYGQESFVALHSSNFLPTLYDREYHDYQTSHTG